MSFFSQKGYQNVEIHLFESTAAQYGKMTNNIPKQFSP